MARRRFAGLHQIGVHMTNIIFFIVQFLSNTIQTITGFAGTLLAMPPSILLIGMDNARVVLNATAWISGLLIAVQNYKSINYKELFKMIGFMFAGMILGMYLYDRIPGQQLLTIYGILVILIGVKNLVMRKERTYSKWVLTIVLLAAGIIHGMFVSGGALLVIYACQTLKDKNEFRATVAPIWVVLNTFMMAGYCSKGQVTPYCIMMILVTILPLLLALWVGNRLQKKINQKTFLYLTYVLLIISGVSIL